MVIKPITINVRSKKCDCKEGSSNILCDLKFPICWIYDLYGQGKANTIFKFLDLSQGVGKV